MVLDLADRTDLYRMELSLTRPQLLGLLAGAGHDGVAMTGDTSLLPKLLSMLDDPDPDFSIVTP